MTETTEAAEASIPDAGQLRMAKRFAAEHGHELRYVHDIGWHKWTGTHWKPDHECEYVLAAVQSEEHARRELEKITDLDDLKQALTAIRAVQSKGGAEGVLWFARAMSPISTPVRNIDADPYLFNTPRGAIDLRTGELLSNDRAHLITKISRGIVVQNLEPGVFAEFLERIQPDPAIRSFLQRLFGSAMLGTVTEHILPILIGVGANGKSTLLNAISNAFADYAITVDPAMLMQSKHERHGAFKMRLRGARLAICSETVKEGRLSEATVKNLTGGDMIEANYMHQNPIEFKPSHTIIMATNHLPQISGADDSALWRRILVVPFDEVIPPEEQNGELPGLLELAADEIIKWCFDGWLEYRKHGLNAPETVKIRTMQYRNESDHIGAFLEEMTEKAEGAKVKAKELFDAWTEWARDNSTPPGTKSAFRTTMIARGYYQEKQKTGAYWFGLMLNQYASISSRWSFTGSDVEPAAV